MPQNRRSDADQTLSVNSCREKLSGRITTIITGVRRNDNQKRFLTAFEKTECSKRQNWKERQDYSGAGRSDEPIRY